MLLFVSKKLVFLLPLAVLLHTSSVWSADLTLRERATVSGPVIRLGDVADISASTSTRLKNLVTTPLFPAPAPGTQRFLSQLQVRDLLVSRGIDITNLRIRGAKVVEIGNQPAAVEPAAPAMSLAETEAALEDAIKRHLIDRTGHGQWRVAVKLRESDYMQAAGWGSDFTVEGGRQPKTGRLRFQIGARGIKESVQIEATVTKIHSLVFARRAIARGSLVRVTDIEVRQHEGSVPSMAIRDMKQVIGMAAKRAISPDAILTEGHVSAPILVKRGETVTVFARTGGVTVRTMAVARQDGAMGDLVQVESMNSKSKQRYAARVSGNRRLDVYPTGARVEDFATLGHKSSHRQ
ncbi:MAG: flagellar basal body P-ring formation protein FlgA [Planctomycetes bacterium]|nr:flagellar basal body P-ring formation protein FlgA [Planctomycetota bacterium]